MPGQPKQGECPLAAAATLVLVCHDACNGDEGLRRVSVWGFSVWHARALPGPWFGDREGIAETVDRGRMKGWVDPLTEGSFSCPGLNWGTCQVLLLLLQAKCLPSEEISTNSFTVGQQELPTMTTGSKLTARVCRPDSRQAPGLAGIQLARPMALYMYQ